MEHSCAVATRGQRSPQTTEMLVLRSARRQDLISATTYFRAALRHDVAFIASGGDTRRSPPSRFGPSARPNGCAIRWWNLEADLPREDDWQVWIDWYNRRLKGVSDPEEIELVFATVPDKEREAGPAAANRWIKERLEEFRKASPLQTRLMFPRKI